jgi:hypothetical protein
MAGENWGEEGVFKHQLATAGYRCRTAAGRTQLAAVSADLAGSIRPGPRRVCGRKRTANAARSGQG